LHTGIVRVSCIYTLKDFHLNAILDGTFARVEPRGE